MLSILFLAPFDGLRFGHLSASCAQRPASRAARALRRRPALAPGRGRRILFPPAVRALPGRDRERAAQPAAAALLRPMVRGSSTTARPRPGTWPTAPSACFSHRRRCSDARRCAGDPGAAWRLALLGSTALLGRCCCAALLGRALVVSLMDNAPHYGGELADPGQGYDLSAPRPDRIPGAQHQPARHPSSASEPALERPARGLPA